ncbi:MAG TPA: hypothetical protein VFF08_02900 [Trueperaceae bacterium]|nr:hypothetical protein [Trueperaceae bacterium]
MAANDDGEAPTGTAGVRASREEPPPLPEPPEVERRVRLVPTQVAGLVMVGLMPLLSFFGLFGLGVGNVEARGELVTVRAQHPTVHRLKVRRPLVLLVTNASGAALPAVELRLSRGYVEAFSDVSFTPAPDAIEPAAYVFVVTGLAPGETRVVSGEMQANDYWRHEATLSWRVLDEAGAALGGGELAFGTFVWP